MSARKRSYRKNDQAVSLRTWLLVLGGAFAGAYAIRTFVQKPIDAARGVVSP